MSTSEALQNEIRTTRPAAPAALRERVRSLAVERPIREPLLARLLPRRAVLVPVALLVLVVGLGAVRLAGTDGDSARIGTRVAGGAATAESSADSALKAAAPPTAATAPSTAGTTLRGAPGPTAGRLQDVDVEMRLRVADVEELSTATKRAMRLAQSLGGFVASVQYDAPSQGVGGAQLVLRIPNARVQGAITELSSLGTILGQRIGISDLQESADDLGDQIVDTRRTIAGLRRQLAGTSLVDEERAVLQARLAQARSTLTDLRASLRVTHSEGSLATVQLSLTTERIAAAKTTDGPLDKLKDVLVWEGVALLYIVVLAGPIVLLAVILWLLSRSRRRREEARLLST